MEILAILPRLLVIEDEEEDDEALVIEAVEGMLPDKLNLPIIFLYQLFLS